MCIRDSSGGERTRLALARTMIEPANLLVLDEPTNHLDLPSCDVLEDALTAYPGTVLLVTHDRHLIRNVADAIIDVRDGRATWYDGVPEEVLTPADPSRVAGANTSLTAGGARAERRRAGATERQNATALRKRVRELERELERAETTVDELQNRLADPAIYDRPEEVHRLAVEHEEAKALAATLMSEWESAAERLEAGGG